MTSPNGTAPAPSPEDRSTPVAARGTSQPAKAAATVQQDRGTDPVIASSYATSWAKLANEALTPPEGYGPPPVGTATARAGAPAGSGNTAVPATRSPARQPLPATPARGGRPAPASRGQQAPKAPAGRGTVSPGTLGTAPAPPPAQPLARTQEQQRWARRYASLSNGPISLKRAIDVTRTFTVGDLRAAGMRLAEDLPDSARLRDVPHLIAYVGSDVLVSFDRYGQLHDTIVGSGARAYPVHTWIVQGVTGLADSKGSERLPMPGVFIATQRQYAIVDTVAGAGSDRSRRIAVRDGSHRIVLMASQPERDAIDRESADQQFLLAIVSPSYWQRLDRIDFSLETLPRLNRLREILLNTDYVREALGPRLQQLSAARLALEVAKSLLADLIKSPLPGQAEDFLDASLRQLAASHLAHSGAVNAEADLDVAARVVAPELADLVVGALSGAAGKARKNYAAGRRALARATDAAAPPPAIRGTQVGTGNGVPPPVGGGDGVSPPADGGGPVGASGSGGRPRAGSAAGRGTSEAAIEFAEQVTRQRGVRRERAVRDEAGVSVTGPPVKGTGRTKIPRSDGGWDGTPGDSGWVSFNLEVIRVTSHEPVPFRNGEPVFKQWAVAQVGLPRMTGAAGKDFPAARIRLLWRYPGRWKNLEHVERWERDGVEDNFGRKLAERHTWHHEPDVETMSLVPTALNDNVPHLGGASKARAGEKPFRFTPDD
ncbi:HNH endonuclease [Amycolatopsis sp. NPDC049688]|uniref:HNH endonuclease n=1 Tax=Amycolatopsis sp. NPDC049688 TaxID=3154733 RepID=UPI00342524C2